jgi:uncharacterized membrane protein YfcA
MVDAIVALFIGLAGGFAGGLLGIGGGAIYVPALVLLLDEKQHLAQGASFVAIVPTAIVGTLTHLRNRNVDLPIVAVVAPAAVLLGFIAGFIADRLDETTLQRIFGVVMVYFALTTIRSALQRGTTPVEGTD